jgi:hypothetical protein
MEFELHGFFVFCPSACALLRTPSDKQLSRSAILRTTMQIVLRLSFFCRKKSDISTNNQLYAIKFLRLALIKT